MVTNYTINIVNHSADLQTFWAFLERPQELVADEGVFANSNARLAVRPNAIGNNRFVIPVQYKVGAGASNAAIGLNIKVESEILLDSAIGQQWDADYKDTPPPQGPELKLGGTAPENTISIVTNNFNKVQNEIDGWFANQTFGMMTNHGFIGMTWSPKTSQKRTLLPKLTFYIAVGRYGSNTLADWNDVSNTSAKIEVPGDFLRAETTVTYTERGEWEVSPGAPSPLLVSNLGSQTGENLAAGAPEVDQVVRVDFDGDEPKGADAVVGLTGTLTITSALAAGFAYFFLAGVRFRITSSTTNATMVDFSYDGGMSRQAIESLFQVGASVLFTNTSPTKVLAA